MYLNRRRQQQTAIGDHRCSGQSNQLSSASDPREYIEKGAQHQLDVHEKLLVNDFSGSLRQDLLHCLVGDQLCIAFDQLFKRFICNIGIHANNPAALRCRIDCGRNAPGFCSGLLKLWVVQKSLVLTISMQIVRPFNLFNAKVFIPVTLSHLVPM